jgi:DNA-binding GntR family transcriptional regulator
MLEQGETRIAFGAPTTLASSVYERLRRDIVEGQLAPGEKLRIESLRALYGIGASPLREALNRLSAEGLVIQEDQRGFRVPPVSIDDLQELTRTRCWLNEIGLRESIARGGPEWEEQIVVAHHRLTRTPFEFGDPAAANAEWERRHREFHAALIAACGSRWIAACWVQLFDLADRYRHLSKRGDGQHRDFNAEHRAMMEATLARNTELAVRLLNEHVSRTAELVTRLKLTRLEPDPKTPDNSKSHR